MVGRQAGIVLYVLAMVAVVVGGDVAFSGTSSGRA